MAALRQDHCPVLLARGAQSDIVTADVAEEMKRSAARGRT